MKKNKNCLACVLHQRIPTKDIVLPIIESRDKELEEADEDDWKVNEAWDKFYEMMGKTDVIRVCASDDPQAWDGVFDMYTHDDVTYMREII